ncbi:response regulator [Ammonifex thiophilus]|uniref:response regulator n=1 Tax=Ammonifex thiophilus TaxID=444093 RepID=UPI001F0BB7D8|nr:response regulator [Ammonifex thiophilus]
MLVIDDEPLVRLVVREALSASGWRVAEAAGGEEAWELISQERPDLVLLDLRCSGGEELLARLRGKVPVVVMTGDEEAAQGLGVEVLLKPFDLDKLRKLVRSKLSGI